MDVIKSTAKMGIQDLQEEATGALFEDTKTGKSKGKKINQNVRYDDILPTKKKIEPSQLQQNNFMKFHMMQSELHEDDREKATAIVKNMYPPNWQTKEGRALKRNPFFAE